MVFGILLFLFLLVCIFLCLLILIQSDKGGGISGSIGGLSGANNFLGTQDTANVLTKGTYVFGGVFLTLCVLMTFFVPGSGTSAARSDLQKFAEKNQAITSAPATPIAEMLGAEDEASETEAAGAMLQQLMEQAEKEQAPAAE